MANPLRVPYTMVDPSVGDVGIAPYLPLTLEYQGQTITASALLDTGSSLNVLPYSVGLSLGAVWREQSAVLNLGGNLAQFPACPLFLNATVGTFAPVRLAFAWMRAEYVPLLLGQVNFFMEFNICFYRSQKAFEVQPNQG
jgi:hypothetical protein